jgi:hypothetical protein
MRYKCTHQKYCKIILTLKCVSLFSVTLKRIYLVTYNYKQYQLNSYGPAPISIIKNTKVLFGCKCLGLYLNCSGNIESELKWIGLQFQRVAWYLIWDWRMAPNFNPCLDIETMELMFVEFGQYIVCLHAWKIDVCILEFLYIIFHR